MMRSARLFRFAISPSAAARSRSSATLSQRAAFTLIELLVVVAIIALLISILLPNLGRAREQARAAVCGTGLRDLASGLAVYTAQNQDWLPGMNTTGVALREIKNTMADTRLLNRPKLPVQTTDWMTPIVSQSLELPTMRAEKWKFLFDKYACPSQRYTSTVYPLSLTPDRAEFNKLVPWRAASYAMSAWFQYVGQSSKRYLSRLSHPNPAVNIQILGEAANPTWEVVVDSYEPRITSVGPPARKLFVSDATRFVSTAQNTIDFDPAPVPDHFGAFSCSGGWWGNGNSLGAAQGSTMWQGTPVPTGSTPRDGSNLPVSYRHGSVVDTARTVQQNRGAINALFFDGHVERLGDRESREIYMWYPSGARVTKPAEGMTLVPTDFVVP